MLRAMHDTSAPLTATCDAPAKVNLCLRIVGRRSDGYHLLDSIFAAIDLADRMTITVADAAPGRATIVDVACALPGVPNDATNLAARAAVALLEACDLGADVAITIDKRIPPGSGLGGGSSNAAAVLCMLTRLLRLDVAPQRLHALALGLGADVPFFLTGGCARVRGIGERVDPIAGWPGFGLIVALPPIAVSTAWAFRSYTGGFAVDPREPERLASAAQPTAEWLRNDLEAAVLPSHPAIGEMKRALVDAGAAATVMSGSGAAVVGLVPSGVAPEQVAERLRERYPAVRFHAARILPARDATTVDRPRSYA
jgi:4-diphosphocytidyl-2-C-methyl-D-erythritol kinase